MTNTTQDTQQETAEAKRLILSGLSYAKAAKQVGLDSFTLLNRLRDDKDILAAKAAGLLNKPRNTSRRVKYAELPCVIDVVQNGMTQAEAAEKHRVSQPYISRCVRKAREELAQAAPTAKIEANSLDSARIRLRDAALAAREEGLQAAEIVQITAEAVCK